MNVRIKLLWGQKELLMEPDKAQSVVGMCAAAVSDAKDQLIEFLTDNTVPLLSSIRSYVLRMGLAKGEAVPAAALEVLQEVVVEALNHADRFDPTRQPMAWLLGIAMNMIKRKKVEAAKHYQRELSIGRFATPEPVSDSELFDQISPLTFEGPERDVEANEQVSTLLALVSEDDQHVLRLAFVYDFDRDSLAQQLNITPVAARVRLHRALNRLRSAWRQQQEETAERE